MSSPPFPPPREPLTDGVVRLREWCEADVRALVAAVDDPQIARWTRIPSPYTEAHARDFLAGRVVDELSLAVVAAADDRLMGGIGLHEARPGTGRAGYWTAAAARGRGVAPRALTLLAGWALGELGLRRLEVLVQPDNRASRRVAEKAGFRLEGLRSGGIERPDGGLDAVVFVRD